MSLFPCAIVSDLHCHDWSMFSSVDESGVNTRLKIILDELMRAAMELQKAKGKTMFIAGDLFHVRGKIKPSVLNPVLETCRMIRERLSIEIIAIPGNHDLENKESDKIGNAMHAIASTGATICDRAETFDYGDGGRGVCVVPWFSSVEDLRAWASRYTTECAGDPSKIDLIIHAPVNGVIMGIPDTGLSPSEIQDWGFNRVFAGHFHNHVDFGDGVFSVGATTHQTWGDVGSKAGFMLVGKDKEMWRASRAPQFIDITGEESEKDLPLMVDGNYVRVKLDSAEPKDVERIRGEITEMGALGVVVHAVAKPVVTRSGATVKAGASLHASIAGFIDEQKYDNKDDVKKACLDILDEARSEAA